MNMPNTRILAIDDDRDLRDLLQQYLAREHFDVHYAEDDAAMDGQLQTHTFEKH